MLDLSQLERIAKEAAKNSFLVWQKLGEKGKEKKRVNAYGEIALTADLECGNAILDVLRKSEVPIRIYSEEDGVVDIGQKKPVFLGVLDGLDGTRVYSGVMKGHTRYGTSFAIFDGINPRYGDYLVSVFMEHPTATLFYAVRGKGAWKQVGSGPPIKIATSSKMELDRDTSIIVDLLFDRVFAGDFMQRKFIDKLQGFNIIRDCGSAQTGYLELATGNADAVCELTRKMNLEPAAAYALIIEAGGEMLARDDSGITPLGDRRYLSFGQKEGDRFEFVTAATSALAWSLSAQLFSLNRL